MLFFSSQCQVARFYETKLKIRVYTFSYLSLSAFYLRFIPYQGIRMSHLPYSSAKNSSGHGHYHLLRRGPRRHYSSAHTVGTWYKMLIVIKRRSDEARVRQRYEGGERAAGEDGIVMKQERRDERRKGGDEDGTTATKSRTES
ncbi:unnamed protein product [Vicia faba]|uniref:Uncharacterized protein n=1 Tax=Vicia faba TaxID=3906 RepID=A0AAV0YU68_VICFA|nr:unnamed protein product [Vicia faba]